MKARTMRLDVTAAVVALAAFFFMALTLMVCVATVAGGTGHAVATVAATTVADAAVQAGTGVRSVASAEDDDVAADRVMMSIDLDEGAAINVDIPDQSVVIDTWRGDDVLVIVEKNTAVKREVRPAGPVNLQVTRSGRDVRIATLDEAHKGHALYGVNFTILVPERYAGMRTGVKDSYSFGKLTSVLWRTVGKEILKWVAF